MGGHRPTVVAFRLRLAAPAVFCSWNGLAAACMAPLAEAWARAFCVAKGSTRRLDGGDPTSVALHTRAAVASTRALPSCNALVIAVLSRACTPCRSLLAHHRCEPSTPEGRRDFSAADYWFMVRSRTRHAHSATLATPHHTPTLVGQGFDRRIDGYFLMQHRRRGFGTARRRCIFLVNCLFVGTVCLWV